MNEAPLTPDFIPHEWSPLASAELADGFVTRSWPDGTSLAAYTLWLAENAEGYGLEPSTAETARDQRFQLASPFRPGDLVGFDNRRILHGRDAFESNGARHLRGCYADHSRLRVLRRGRRSPIDRSPTSPTNEVPA